MPAPAQGLDPERLVRPSVSVKPADQSKPAGRRVLQAVTVTFVLALLGLLVWNLARGSQGGKLVVAVSKNQRPLAPPFSLRVVWSHTQTSPPHLRAAGADGTLTLAELRGYPVVVNFWASWCIPCAHEAPALAASALAHTGKIVFVGINVQDLNSPQQQFLTQYDVPYVSVQDSSNGTYDAYGLTGLPETYYIDRRGRILAHDVGEVSRSSVEREIRRIAS